MNVTRDKEEGDTCRDRFTVIHTAMSKRKVNKLSKLLDYHAMNHGRRVVRIARARIAYMRIDSHAAGFVCEIRYVTSDCLCARASRIKSRHSPWNGT